MLKYPLLTVLIAVGCTSVKTTSTNNQATDATRLHDIWALKELNGKVLTQADYDEAPYMEINSSTKKVLGHTSCNSFSGSVEITDDKLKFGPLISTRMACAKSVEPEFLKLLNECDSYKFEGRYLLLLKSDGVLAKFLKVD
jgi:heat shock protein HslJ